LKFGHGGSGNKTFDVTAFAAPAVPEYRASIAVSLTKLRLGGIIIQ
jgi:hypothetical protein